MQYISNEKSTMKLGGGAHFVQGESKAFSRIEQRQFAGHDFDAVVFDDGNFKGVRAFRDEKTYDLIGGQQATQPINGTFAKALRDFLNCSKLTKNSEGLILAVEYNIFTFLYTGKKVTFREVGRYSDNFGWTRSLIDFDFSEQIEETAKEYETIAGVTKAHYEEVCKALGFKIKKNN